MEGKKEEQSNKKEYSSAKGKDCIYYYYLCYVNNISYKDEDEINSKDSKALETAAATKIQAGWKGYKVRKDNKTTTAIIM